MYYVFQTEWTSYFGIHEELAKSAAKQISNLT